MFKQISKLALSSVVVAALLLSGCGGGTGTTAQGGSITINPSSIAWNITAGACGGPFNYHEVVITVLNSNKVPVANAGLTVTLDLANATYSGGPAMTLYDDPTWISGSFTPPTTAPVGARYATSTGGDGTKRLIVGVDLGCTYKGNLNVYSGALFQSVNIAITG